MEKTNADERFRSTGNRDGKTFPIQRLGMSTHGVYSETHASNNRVKGMTSQLEIHREIPRHIETQISISSNHSC